MAKAMQQENTGQVSYRPSAEAETALRQTATVLNMPLNKVIDRIILNSPLVIEATGIQPPPAGPPPEILAAAETLAQYTGKDASEFIGKVGA